MTSLRFFAAGLVVALHSTGHFGIPADIIWHFGFVQGVSFFFVLSGFVLSYVYPDLNGRARIIAFLTARIARIWPLHAVAAIASIWLLYGSIYDLSLLGFNLGMIHAWIPVQKYFFSYNSPSWAVSTEFGLYFCFLFLIRNWQKTCVTKITVTLFLLILIIAGCRFFNIPQLPENEVGYAGILYVNPIGRLYEFVLGMVTASLYRKIKPHYHPGGKVAFLIEITMIGAVLLSLWKSQNAGAFFRPWIGEIVCYWIALGGISSFFFAGLILVMGLHHGILSRCLSRKPFVLLGETSFAIYLFHQILIRYYTQHMDAFRGFSNVTLYGMFLTVLLVVSFLARALVEKPARNLIIMAIKRIRTP